MLSKDGDFVEAQVLNFRNCMGCNVTTLINQVTSITQKKGENISPSHFHNNQNNIFSSPIKHEQIAFSPIW